MSRAAQDIATDIRRYCAANPHARDSIDGIAWWVALQRVEDTRAEFQQAVEWLVAQGLLAAHRLADGSVVFACTTACAQPDTEDTA
jgi:hypothetical protein